MGSGLYCLRSFLFLLGKKPLILVALRPLNQRYLPALSKEVCSRLFRGISVANRQTLASQLTGTPNCILYSLPKSLLFLSRLPSRLSTTARTQVQLQLLLEMIIEPAGLCRRCSTNTQLSSVWNAWTPNLVVQQSDVLHSCFLSVFLSCFNIVTTFSFL